MRAVFQSQRLETAEGVAELLRQAGIGVRLDHGLSYQYRRHGWSYLEGQMPRASSIVWVLRPDDQPRARHLLRQAGLLPDLPWSVQASARQLVNLPSVVNHRVRWQRPIRLGLILILLAVAWQVIFHRSRPSSVFTASQSTNQPQVGPQPREQKTEQTPVRAHLLPATPSAPQH